MNNAWGKRRGGPTEKGWMNKNYDIVTRKIAKEGNSSLKLLIFKKFSSGFIPFYILEIRNTVLNLFQG